MIKDLDVLGWGSPYESKSPVLPWEQGQYVGGQSVNGIAWLEGPKTK